MNRLLILEPDDSRRAQLSHWLQAQGFMAESARSVAHAEAGIAPLSTFSLIVCAADLMDEALSVRSVAPVVVAASPASIPAAVRAIKRGAADYLELHDEPTQLLAVISQHLSATTTRRGLEVFPMLGRSVPMRSLTESIAKVAPTESTVLIRGESGTGKELVARALHAGSKRRVAPLISLNCAAVPSNMIDTELFGHDATHEAPRRGLLEAAEGGTLFLDEVAELPPETQARLLHILEGRQLDGRQRPVDVRLITATQRDLEQLVGNNQFRGDLYYRLNVVSLQIPPLRDRGEDVLLLAEAIVERTTERLGRSPLELAEDAKKAMARYHWPGNVRELENAIERAIILSEGGQITATLLAIDATPGHPAETGARAPEQTMEDYFVSFVTAHQDQLTETELAERLGISRKSLWERRQRLNIPRKKTRKRGPRREIS